MKTLIYINQKQVALEVQKVIEKNKNGTWYVAVNVSSREYPLVSGNDYINEASDPRDITTYQLMEKAVQSFKNDLLRSTLYYSTEVEKMKSLIGPAVTKTTGGFL